jgi:hypothetical protein
MAGRRLLGTVGIAIASFVATWSLAVGPIDRYRSADLEPEQDLPPEVRAEVDATWGAFLAVFGPRRHCFGDVALLLVADVEGGDARYDVEAGRIEIEIPTSPARFRDSLAHELAHHVEHTCAAFGSLRAEFSALPGVDGAPWTTAERWRETPSELWAETAVQLVNGRRVRHGWAMPLPPGATDVVARWAGGASR